MADVNQAAEDLARAMAKVQEELALLGKTTQQTQSELKDAQMKAKYGIENYTKGTEKAAEGAMALGQAAFGAGKAMLEGKKGAAALNSSFDNLATAAQAAGAALAIMVPGGMLIKGLIAGITALSVASFKYANEAREMADQLHKGYIGLAKAGGAAADGMTGLKNDAQKLGLSMGELDQLVSIVAANSKDFALFAGSVSQGRKQFAAIGEAMTPARQGLLNLGMDMKDINEGTAEYMRTQARTGRAQQMTTAQLAKGAEAYLKEMDGLTKLTGQSRSEMQAQRDRMMQQEQSAAKLRAMEMSGNKEGAEALKTLGNMLGSAGPKMQAAFNASITGNLASKEAQEANLASQGELARVVELVQNKQITAAEGAQRVAKAMGNTADTVGTQLGQLNAYESSGYGNFAEQQNLRILAENNFTKTLAEINKDQQAQIAGADKITDNQSKIVQANIAANKAMTDFIAKGIGPAQEQMILLVTATEKAAKALDTITGKSPGAAMGAAQGAGVGAGVGAVAGTALGAVLGGPAGAILGAKIGTAAGAALGGLVGGYLGSDKSSGSDGENVGPVDMSNIPMAADGGVLVGPQSGYLAMLHGKEYVFPEDQLLGKISSGGMAGAGGEQLNKMNTLYNEMLKDTINLEKLTDQDLKKTRDFSRVADRLRTLKTDLMNDEIDLLEEQNNEMEKILDAIEQAVGKEAVTAARKNFIMQRSMSGMGGMSMGGGSGLQMPPATPPAAGMSGGQGLVVKNQDDLKGLGLKLKTGDVQAEGAKISPKLIELAKAVQAGVPGFNQFTGFNDKWHNEKAPSSKHTQGLAMDFTVAQQPSVEDGKKVTDWLKSMGASLAIDEYNNPTANATAGHFHAQIPAFKDGGIVDDATLSLIGEAGPEAVIPLKDGNVPVSFNGKMGLGDEAMGLFKIMAEQTATMAAMMEQMVAAQKNSVDVQTKMLRAQS
jgi:hypothetical protein